MPTIKDKLNFNFNGIWADSYGLMNVVLDSGMYDELFVASREINETSLKGSNKPLFHSVSNSPIEFEMVIAFKNDFNQALLNNIVKWLFVDYYKPLYFEGAEDRIVYCMPIGEPRII